MKKKAAESCLFLFRFRTRKLQKTCIETAVTKPILIHITSGDPVKTVSWTCHPTGQFQHMFSIQHFKSPRLDFLFPVGSFSDRNLIPIDVWPPAADKQVFHDPFWSWLRPSSHWPLRSYTFSFLKSWSLSPLTNITFFRMSSLLLYPNNLLIQQMILSSRKRSIIMQMAEEPMLIVYLLFHFLQKGRKPCIFFIPEAYPVWCRSV